MDYNNYISEIKRMISKLNVSDTAFIKRLYTIVLIYLEKRGRH